MVPILFNRLVKHLIERGKRGSGVFRLPFNGLFLSLKS